MSAPTCIVCDGLVGCEFCPRGWTPPTLAFNLGRTADKHERPDVVLPGGRLIYIKVGDPMYRADAR